MFTETKLDEKNRENEMLSFDLEEAHRSKPTLDPFVITSYNYV